MNIGICAYEFRKNKLMLRALKLGISNMGHNFIEINNLEKITNIDKKIDFYITWSIPDNDKKTKNYIFKNRDLLFKHVNNDKIFIIESAFFRKHQTDVRITRKGMLYTDSFFINHPDYQKFKEFKQNYSIINQSNDNLGFILQLPHDKSHKELEPNRSINYTNWVISLAEDFLGKTNQNIILRFHPLTLNKKKTATNAFYRKIVNFVEENDRVFIDDSKTMNEFLSKSSSTHSFGSTGSIESFISGIQTNVYSKNSWTYNISELSNFSNEEKNNWLAILSNNQYNLKEISKGSFFRLLDDKYLNI